jgi:DNA-binding NarL/FixJ family response regulator
MGYLLNIRPHRLPQALEAVLAGDAALPRGMVARVIVEFRRREKRGRQREEFFSALTDREWQTLLRLHGGLTTAEIAAEHYVSQVTVRTHVAAILRKLHVEDRASAIRLIDDEVVTSR